MQQGNYVVARQRLTDDSMQTIFGKVTEISKGIAVIKIEKDSHVKERFSEVPVKDIVVDLGTSPHPGSVYGQDVTSRLIAKRDHDFFGPYFWFYKPRSTDVVTKVEAAFDDMAAILKKHKLPAPYGSVLELRSMDVSGKWAGYYKHSKNTDKNPHRISLKPEMEGMTPSAMQYIIAHEYAHWFHFNCVTGPKLNARWIRLFNTSIKLQTVTKEDSKALLESLLGGEVRPSDFRSDLDEDQRNQFNWICRTIKSEHALSLHEMDLLFEADFKDDIRGVWPKNTLSKKDLKPVISEYATLNYRETFAESLAFYLIKRKLPEAVTALVEKSIEFGRANSEKT
jgi:hypothetical protein